ncbi:MAG: putative peptidoglycan glycosyltransferase FtsW [bacterium]|nr:putative peptidoglycan glycosyltransferase FtsW [bacterium]
MSPFHKNKIKVDRVLLTLTSILVIGGIFIFISAAMGLLAREKAVFFQVLGSQLGFGLVLGSVAAWVASRVHYKFWRKYAFYIFLVSILLTLLPFVPGIGLSHAGASRWFVIAGISFQPAEILKLGFVIYFATWLSGVNRSIHSYQYGIVPLFILLGVTGAVLLSQPDTGTFLSIVFAALAMFIAAGAKWRDILITSLVLMICAGGLVATRPYLLERFTTFVNPSADPWGSSYQVRQSLIAIGSGGVWGRGFGQSVQKFQYLPEPVGDSIFAVFGEEWGFVGVLTLIGLFVAFSLRGLLLARRSPDIFGGLLIIGIVILIVVGAFVNIASMLGIFPLSGQPLPFVSHGGSALFVSLVSVGIILNVSRYAKQS